MSPFVIEHIDKKKGEKLIYPRFRVGDGPDTLSLLIDLPSPFKDKPEMPQLVVANVIVSIDKCH
jgi:hypothetical protein